MTQLEAYHDFTRRLQTTLAKDERILGLVALGSMAEIRRMPDEWSDHDFFVITQPGVQESFRQDLHWLPDHAAIVLSIRETAHGLKVLYADGHLIEFAVFDPVELSVAKVNDYRILLDRASISTLIANIVHVPIPSAEYNALHDFAMVIVLLYVGAGRYARGERLSAHNFIKTHSLHHLLPLLAHILDSSHKSQLDSLDPFRRFEQVFPAVGDAINRALLLPCLEAADALLTLAEQHAQPVLENYPHPAVHTIRDYLHALMRNPSRPTTGGGIA